MNVCIGQSLRELVQAGLSQGDELLFPPYEVEVVTGDTIQEVLPELYRFRLQFDAAEVDFESFLRPYNSRFGELNRRMVALVYRSGRLIAVSESYAPRRPFDWPCVMMTKLQSRVHPHHLRLRRHLNFLAAQYWLDLGYERMIDEEHVQDDVKIPFLAANNPYQAAVVASL